MQEPLVSILIAAYNAENTIAEAIDSCLEQSYKNIEIIVCNDGSTDDTLHEINIGNSEKIEVINHASNKGIAYTRNTLLKASNGEYIAWLDADDFMDEARIGEQLNYMLANPTIDICGSWVMLVGKNGLSELKKLPTNSNFIKAHLWFKNCLVQPSIFSRNLYKTENIFYNPDFDYMEDYELWVRLRNTKQFSNIDKYLTYYTKPDNKELEAKHIKYRFNEKQAKLWEIKWQEIPNNLGKEAKKNFQLFLKVNKKLNAYEINDILRCLKAIENNDVNKELNSFIQYHRFRVWKNGGLVYKIKNLRILLKTFSFLKFKQENNI